MLEFLASMSKLTELRALELFDINLQALEDLQHPIWQHQVGGRLLVVENCIGR